MLSTHPPHFLLSGRVLPKGRRAKGGFFTSIDHAMATIRVPFNKPASSPEQLLQKLEQQGLAVDDDSRPTALHYMRFVGGYRLKGYWHHWVDPVTKAFPAGYRFEQLAARCEFDRWLARIKPNSWIKNHDNDPRAIRGKYSF